MNLLTWLAAWLDARLDKRMSLDGDLMTPDWHDGDGTAREVVLAAYY